MSRDKYSSDIDKLGEVKHSIEITPQMIEAGVHEYFMRKGENDSNDNLVSAVFRAMTESYRHTSS